MYDASANVAAAHASIKIKFKTSSIDIFQFNKFPRSMYKVKSKYFFIIYFYLQT